MARHGSKEAIAFYLQFVKAICSTLQTHTTRGKPDPLGFSAAKFSVFKLFGDFVGAFSGKVYCS